jgi:hypothetical protein
MDITKKINKQFVNTFRFFKNMLAVKILVIFFISAGLGTMIFFVANYIVVKNNLTNIITSSGRLFIGNQHGTDGNWFLGHLSSSTSSERSMIGIEFAENSGTSVRFYAKVGSPNGANNSTSDPITLNNGTYNYTYTYDPGIGSFGRLTVRIYNDALTYDQTNLVNLSSATRSSGAAFDAFGIGTTEGVNGWNNPDEYIYMYIDDVTYSGQNASAPTINVTATDSAASESGPENGTFTITRTGSSGNLTVFYSVSGSATSGSDYSAISTSVAIPNGSTSATVTVVPIDDTDKYRRASLVAPAPSG